MIIPCIDLMGGKVVQLVQGREKALEADGPLEMLHRFRAFPQIQVIDLDAAMSKGSNDALVEVVASRAIARVGGGVRSPERARALIEQGAYRVIVGTAAFDRERRQSGHARLAGGDERHGRGDDPSSGAVLLGLPLHLCR